MHCEHTRYLEHNHHSVNDDNYHYCQRNRYFQCQMHILEETKSKRTIKGEISMNWSLTRGQHSKGNRICEGWGVQGEVASLVWLEERELGECSKVRPERWVNCERPCKILRSPSCRIGTGEPWKIYKGIFWDGRQRPGFGYLQQAEFSDLSFHPTLFLHLNTQSIALKILPSCPCYRGAKPGVGSIVSTPSACLPLLRVP